MGVQELIFAFVDMLHMLSYVHQGGGGWGGINVPDEYFTYVTEHVAVVKCCQHVAHAVVYSSGVGGCINVPDAYFTYVTEHVAVVNMLHMLSYIHQGGRGVY